MTASTPSARAYDAVLFDLLTALLDSWTLWNSVAGNAAAGRRWRAEYLKITYACGQYRPYEDLVAQAARDVGLSRDLAKELGARFAELQPWPGVHDALARLHGEGIPLGAVTNCSEELGRTAANCVGVPFAVLVTAERAGYYNSTAALSACAERAAGRTASLPVRGGIRLRSLRYSKGRPADVVAQQSQDDRS
jgi:FMN phosphatase YigB (HAD superfamily)